MTDFEIKNSITKKAVKYGVPTPFSILYDDLPVAFKNSFEEEIKDKHFGLPIVKYDHPNGHWVIVGSQKIAINSGNLIFIPIEDIKNIDIPISEHKRVRLIQPNRMIRKFEYEILKINTFNSGSINIWLNKKYEYYGFWHLLIRFFHWRIKQ